MAYHGISIVPVGRDVGWTLPDNGNPTVWWRARLSDDSHLSLTDGTDLGKRELWVGVGVEEQGSDGTTLPVPVGRACPPRGATSLSIRMPTHGGHSSLFPNRALIV